MMGKMRWKIVCDGIAVCIVVSLAGNGREHTKDISGTVPLMFLGTQCERI